MKQSDAEKFLGLPPGAFDHIPGYALHGAMAAIKKVRALEEQNLFRPGLYYLVLTDLTASTVASAKLSATLNQRRIETFITATVEALGNINHRNYAQFIKEIGDATLFIFSSFEDVHDWWIASQQTLDSYNDEYLHSDEVEEAAWQYFELSSKTAVHAGEVAFSDGNRPVAAAVNQIFKIEKEFGPRELGITESVRQAATPLILDRQLTVNKRSAVILPGEDVETSLWHVDTFPRRD